MLNSIFTTIKLSNGVRCDIFELRAGHLMKANFEMQNATARGENKTDISPYLIRQMVLFDNKQPTIEDCMNMFFDDWVKISEVLEAQNFKDYSK